ncbi:MAG: hypothetical protein KGZ83_15835 [Sulfuricella sp.]|nr:hypothetical protein [Sulfuricella sp.]
MTAVGHKPSFTDFPRADIHWNGGCVTGASTNGKLSQQSTPPDPSASFAIRRPLCFVVMRPNGVSSEHPEVKCIQNAQ